MMKADRDPSPPLRPKLHIQVIGAERSGQLFMFENGERFATELNGRVWQLFELLAGAQREASREKPHIGFRSTVRLRAELADRPSRDLSSREVSRRVKRLRDHLAQARFPHARPDEPHVQAFRMQVIEKNGAGYRLSVRPENIH